jgi:hypothetical protein
LFLNHFLYSFLLSLLSFCLFFFFFFNYLSFSFSFLLQLKLLHFLLFFS